MTDGTYFLDGAWNIICDRCGEKFKSTEVKKEWTGLIVCNECWDPRHPQDFLRSVPDTMSVPFTRPRPADIFVNPQYGYVKSVINNSLINGFIING